MKIMFLKVKKWLLVTVGGLLGLSSVNCTLSCEYGCPEADYHLKGTVTNENGVPIEGIVLQNNMQWGVEECDTTDKGGNYSLYYHNVFPDLPIAVDVIDIDGEENGSYKDTVISINTEGIPLTGGDGHWDQGEATIMCNITLEKKTNE